MNAREGRQAIVQLGQVMENPVAGEDRIIFTKTARQTGGELFELEVFIRAGAPGTPEMVHPLQDESFEILPGTLDFRIVGQKQRLKAGESLVIPKGMPHNWWNGSGEEAHAFVQLRPAPRSEEKFANIYGLCSEKGKMPNLLRMAVLVNEHRDEGYLTRPPLVVQRLMFGMLAPIGRMVGYRVHYPMFSDPERSSSDRSGETERGH